MITKKICFWLKCNEEESRILKVSINIMLFIVNNNYYFPFRKNVKLEYVEMLGSA